MKVTRGLCLGTLLHFCSVIVTVEPIKVKDRHYRRHRGVVHWTDKFGRDRSMVDPNASQDSADTSTQSAKITIEKSKAFAEDKYKGINEIDADRNDSGVLIMAHQPVALEEAKKFYNRIPGHEFCDGQKPKSSICDPGDIIPMEKEKQIEAALEAICRGTGCPCGNCSSSKLQCPGYRVSLLVFSTEPYSNGKPYSYESYVDLANSLRLNIWKTGDCDEDVTIVMDTGTDQIFTSIGAKAAELLNPRCAGEVMYDAEYLLNNKNYGQMLIQILRDYRKVFLKDFKCVIERDYVMPTGHIIAIIFGSVCLPIMVCVISVFLGPCFRGSGFGGKRHKTTYSKYRYQAQNSDGTWAAAGSPQIAEDNASLAESGRFQKGIALERRGAAVML